VERTAETGGLDRICDGSNLRSNYSGPRFSDEDWQRITGNYVMQGGYAFGIYCREKDGYTIDAHPVDAWHGTLRFCSDETRRAGCKVEWNRSRYACQPCLK
jgi:hypothetical protein